MQQYVVYAVSLVLMSTTDGEVSRFLPWVSGTDVCIYGTIHGRWCFGIVSSVKNVHVQMRNQLIRSIIQSLLARV